MVTKYPELLETSTLITTTYTKTVLQYSDPNTKKTTADMLQAQDVVYPLTVLLTRSMRSLIVFEMHVDNVRELCEQLKHNDRITYAFRMLHNARYVVSVSAMICMFVGGGHEHAEWRLEYILAAVYKPGINVDVIVAKWRQYITSVFLCLRDTVKNKGGSPEAYNCGMRDMAIVFMRAVGSLINDSPVRQFNIPVVLSRIIRNVVYDTSMKEYMFALTGYSLVYTASRGKYMNLNGPARELLDSRIRDKIRMFAEKTCKHNGAILHGHDEIVPIITQHVYTDAASLRTAVEDCVDANMNTFEVLVDSLVQDRYELNPMTYMSKRYDALSFLTCMYDVTELEHLCVTILDHHCCFTLDTLPFTKRVAKQITPLKNIEHNTPGAARKQTRY